MDGLVQFPNKFYFSIDSELLPQSNFTIDLFIEKHPLFHREFVFFPFKIVNDRLTRLLNFT